MRTYYSFFFTLLHVGGTTDGDWCIVIGQWETADYHGALFCLESDGYFDFLSLKTLWRIYRNWRES